MLPTNAKMTALVCKGLRRPNDKYGGRLAGHQANCSAMMIPTSMPTMPNSTDAHKNWRTTLSL